MFDRLFGKKNDEAPADASPRKPAETLAVTEPTIGLCFNFMRGMAFDSESLSDEGLRAVMQTLGAAKLRATFFCSAKLCEAAPDAIRRIADAGHEIGALGYADEAPNELTDEAVTQLVLSCRSAFSRIGVPVRGFRAPKSKWDDRLMAALPRHGFVYSAEHDHAHHPYWIESESSRVVRIPVRTDDRGLRRSEKTYDQVVSKHLRTLRKALQRKCFATVCFHPWILAESPERLEHWRLWLGQAQRSGAKLVALEDVLPQAATDRAAKK